MSTFSEKPGNNDVYDAALVFEEHNGHLEGLAPSDLNRDLLSEIGIYYVEADSPL
jgi:hypothetical protein